MFKFATSARVLTLALLVILSATGLFAQGAGFGSITGVVQDPSGAVVADAKVVVDNASKGIHRELATSAAGIFNAQALVPAAGYQVTVTKQGFAGYLVKGITVNVGETVSLAPVLKVSASATQVEVSAAPPIVDTTKTETSQVIGSDQLLELPTNGRRVDAFVMLTPGVVADGAFGLLSFRGNPGGNSFLTDGNDTTNAFYNENAGRTRSYNISQDAVQEFQVVSSNFKAEYGRASGGVVNTVTRSGTNTLHGSAYDYFRNRTLNATDATTKSGLLPNGINPPEWRHQAGLSIGGPIVKDKLFYFFNGEMMRRNAPIVSSNIGAGKGNQLFDGSANILADYVNGALKPTTGTNDAPYNVCVLGRPKVGSNAALPALGQTRCDAAVAYLKSRVVPQLVDRKVDNNLLFGKIDYRPTDKDSFSFSANYVDFRSPNGIQTQLSLATGNAIGNNADTNVFDRTFRGSWTRIVSNNAVNEFRYGYFYDRQYDPASPSLLPSFNGQTSPIGLTVNSVSNVGYATSYPRTNPSEKRNQFADVYSLTAGKHTYKFGGDWVATKDYVDNMSNRFGSYSYSSLNQFATDYSGNSAGARSYSSFTQVFGTPDVTVNLKEVSMFAQDDWRLTPKLTLTPGFRVEYSKLPQPSVCNSAFRQTCNINGSGFRYSPRFGFAYALDSKTSVRAGYGIFYNRFTTGTIQNFFVKNGIYQQSKSYTTTGPIFPNFFPANYAVVDQSVPSQIIFADPNFENPYSQQAEFAIEREIMKNTSLTVSYVWSRGLHMLQTMDTNAKLTGFSKTYEIQDAAGNKVSEFTTPTYTRATSYNAQVLELQSAGNSYYNGLLVQLNRRYSKWLQGSIAYTYGHTIDYNQQGAPTFGNAFPTSFMNGDYAAEKGSSTLDTRHRVVTNAVIAPTFYKGDNGFIKNAVNNWQLALVNVTSSSQPRPSTIAVTNTSLATCTTSSYSLNTALAACNLGSTWTLNGLSGSTRVPWQSISALNLGAQFRTDARLSKTFPITERVKVAMGFEAFNIFNHLIVSGSNGRQTQQYNLVTKGATQVLVPNAPYGTITETQVTPDGTTSRRAQANVRITF